MNYNLLPNEGIIIKSEGINNGGTFSGWTDELILTNLNIIHVVRLFIRVKEIRKLPIRSVRIVNGYPQVIVRQKEDEGLISVQIFFDDGHPETFGFAEGEEREAVEWVDSLSQAITGHPSNIICIEEQTGFLGLSSKLKIVTQGPLEPLSDLGTTRNAEKKDPPKIVTKSCIGCGAPVTGKEGEVAICDYCDTKQTL